MVTLKLRPAAARLAPAPLKDWIRFAGNAQAREWALRGRRDHADLAELLAAVVRPTSSCVDVGAHKGSILRLIVQAAPGGRHVAFEPISHLAAALKRDFPGVDVREEALSDETGTSTFVYVPDRPAWSGLRRQDYPTDLATTDVTVDVRRLDDVLEGRDRVDFIKVDVEGAEVPLLRGAAETLRHDRPVLMVEHAVVHAKNYGVTPADFWDTVADLGYTVEALHGGGPIARDDYIEACARYDAEGYGRDAHTNWVLRPQARE